MGQIHCFLILLFVKQTLQCNTWITVLNLCWVIKWLLLNGAQPWKMYGVYFSENLLLKMEKIFILLFIWHFIFFYEGSCDNFKTDAVLLIAPMITVKYFRKNVFKNKLTRVYQIWSNPPIISPDVKHKHNSKNNQGSYNCWKVCENNVY